MGGLYIVYNCSLTLLFSSYKEELETDLSLKTVALNSHTVSSPHRMLQQSILQYTSVLPKYSMIWCIFKDLFKTSKDCGYGNPL